MIERKYRRNGGPIGTYKTITEDEKRKIEYRERVKKDKALRASLRSAKTLQDVIDTGVKLTDYVLKDRKGNNPNKPFVIQTPELSIDEVKDKLFCHTAYGSIWFNEDLTIKTNRI